MILRNLTNVENRKQNLGDDPFTSAIITNQTYSAQCSRSVHRICSHPVDGRRDPDVRLLKKFYAARGFLGVGDRDAEATKNPRLVGFAGAHKFAHAYAGFRGPASVDAFVFSGQGHHAVGG